MDGILIIVAAAGLAASGEDLYHRHVSNWIPIVTGAAALTLQITRSGLHGAVEALSGVAVGLAVFLIFHLVGGLGGGDIKLMGAFGAALGPHGVLVAAIVAAILGAAHAALAMSFHGSRTICYAPSLSAGALLAALAVGGAS